MAEKYSQDFVADYFRQHGCELVGSYVNNQTPVGYRCVCGRESSISFVSFKRGSRCRQCRNEKFSGPGHPRWHSDRKEAQARNLLRDRYYGVLRNSLRATGVRKKGRTIDQLGYTTQQLREHLESHPNWPAVKNVKWNIDHIFPVSAFLQYGIHDIKLINCLENLQPMAESDNLSKQDKFDRPAFEAWLTARGVGYKSWLVWPEDP